FRFFLARFRLVVGPRLRVAMKLIFSLSGLEWSTVQMSRLRILWRSDRQDQFGNAVSIGRLVSAFQNWLGVAADLCRRCLHGRFECRIGIDRKWRTVDREHRVCTGGRRFPFGIFQT